MDRVEYLQECYFAEPMVSLQGAGITKYICGMLAFCRNPAEDLGVVEMKAQLGLVVEQMKLEAARQQAELAGERTRLQEERSRQEALQVCRIKNHLLIHAGVQHSSCD